MGVKHTVLPDGQPPTVAFAVLAQLCGPRANKTEMNATLFINNGEGRNFDFDFFLRVCFHCYKEYHMFSTLWREV